MLIHNWYHSDITGIHYVHEYITVQLWSNPLAFCFPLFPFPFAPLSSPFTYLETLLAVTGFVHLGLRLLVN
jgi:hypothetical protein